MLFSMNSDTLPCVTLGPEDGAAASVVWLHGLGADGNDFVPIVPYLGIPAEARVRFLFPHAPAIPITLNGGMVMPAWYDIAEASLDRRQDDAGVRASATRVRALLDREKERGVPSNRIVLAGFSQGGAIALFEGLRHPDTLAGILALSTYLVCEETLFRELSSAEAETPIFLAHGEHDPMVPLAGGERARDRLIGAGHEVTWRTYPMQHEVTPAEIEDIGAWLRGALGLD